MSNTIRIKTKKYKIVFWAIAFGLIGLGLTIFSQAATPISIDSSLPTPQNVKAYSDDRNITVTWDGVSNNRVIGYYITYRLKGTTDEFKVRQTEYEAIQLQPLTNGREYEVYVQSVAGTFKSVNAGPLIYGGNNKWGVADGKVSNKSTVAYGTPSSARVDSMRGRLTGFFDDFNTVAGPMDELKWNQATTACARAGSASAFINDQFHAHNTVGSAGPNDSYCDRAGIASRPRATFDMSNITESNPGQIEFDIDGASHHRDTWYLDVIPLSARTNKAPLDITSHATSDDSDSDNPGNMLRINSGRDGLKINYYSPSQSPNSLSLFNGTSACYQSWAGDSVTRFDACDLSNKTGNFSSLTEPSMPGFPIPNVRRHWVIQFTPTKIRIFIDNALIAVANNPASFFAEKKFTVHSTVFSYNTGKTDGFDPGPIPSIEMIHWDNFGFNGPAPTEVAHSYLEGGATGTNPTYSSGDTDGYRIPSGSRKTIIPIPDPIGNLVNNQALLYYTIGNFGFGGINWTAGDNIVVNGKRYDVPNPTTQMSKVSNPLADNFIVAAFTLPINKADLKQGNNEVEFRFANASASFINVHMELSYLKSDNTKPAYTQPLSIFGTNFYDITQPPMMNCDQYRYVEQDFGLPYQTGKSNLTTGGQCFLLPKGSHHNTTGGTGSTPPVSKPGRIEFEGESYNSVQSGFPGSDPNASNGGYINF